MDNDLIVSKYAKKIYGFSYSKTKNAHDAEDLSQEILVQLFGKEFKTQQIENMDAYVYRICCYTWSNFLRKNKPAWSMLGSFDDIAKLSTKEDIENDYIKNELHEKLRQEIMYLSRIRREITIMHYYENKTGDEISLVLKIPASTVRWHMKNTKVILKERLEMTEQDSIYQPVRLNVGIDGQGDCEVMNGLATDLIMQNICVICREKPLLIEEIARTLGISTFYLEEKIENLLYMDFIRRVGTNRYQTTFFIEDEKYQLEKLKFSYENTMGIAVPIFNLAKAILPKLRSSGLVDGEFSDDFFLYSIMMELTNNVLQNVVDIADKRMGISWEYPKLKDGSRYFVSADFRWKYRAEEVVEDKGLVEFIKESRCYGISVENTATARSMQYFLGAFGGWRDFDYNDLNKLMRVYSIIKSGETPNEYDKEIIAYLVKEGYVRVENEKPVILVPIIKCGKELDALREMIEKESSELKQIIENEINNSIEPIIKHRKSLSKLLPKYLDENQRNFLLSRSIGFSHSDIIYLLMKNGYLYTPDEEEKKRICTLVYLK